MFKEILDSVGLQPNSIIMDGKLQRCPVEGKPHDKDGAYIAHVDDPPTIWFVNHRTGERGIRSTKRQVQLSTEEKQIIEQRKQQREFEIETGYANAARNAQRVISQAKPCPPDYPYLTAKGIRPIGNVGITRFMDQDCLVFPILNGAGEIVSLQNILPDGTKRLLKNGRKAGCCFPIPGDDGPILIAEGYATGASLHIATGHTVLVAIDEGNLLPVAREARNQNMDRDIIICADNDIAPGKKNVGVESATKAAEAVGGPRGHS